MIKFFTSDELYVIFLIPFPVDMSAGLSIRDSYLEIAKQDKNRVSAKSGLGGEVLISDVFDPIHTLNLTYLPNTKAVEILETLLVLKTQFGVFIHNDSSPIYKGIASECRIIQAPDTGVGNSGFKNLDYKIVMSDYVGAYLKKEF